MAEGIKASGRTENKMGKENFSTLFRTTGEKEFGMKAKESGGSMKISNRYSKL